MNELLPVGSVVLLEGATKKTIIMGIFQISEDHPGEIYEYLGVPYPEGYMGAGTSYLLKQKDVVKVIWRGHEDEEREAMLNMLENLVKQTDAQIAQAAEKEA